jgi:hypothetical protein
MPANDTVTREKVGKVEMDFMVVSSILPADVAVLTHRRFSGGSLLAVKGEGDDRQEGKAEGRDDERRHALPPRTALSNGATSPRLAFRGTSSQPAALKKARPQAPRILAMSCWFSSELRTLVSRDEPAGGALLRPFRRATTRPIGSPLRIAPMSCAEKPRLDNRASVSHVP